MYQPVVGNGAAPVTTKGPLSFLESVRAVGGRTLLVVVLCLLANELLDSLDRVVALLGSLLGIPLGRPGGSGGGQTSTCVSISLLLAPPTPLSGFIIPLVIHLRLVPDSSPFVKCVNWCALVVGTCLSITCTIVTLKTW